MILIIDDDEAVRTSLSLLLKGAGCMVKTAAEPDEAYPVLQEPTLHLVLLDMNFSLETSGKEGLEALQKIKQIRPQLPVILMTGWGSISLAVKGMKYGAADFVHKPWDNNHLLQSIKTALELAKLAEKGDYESTPTRKQLDSQYGFDAIIGQDPALLAVLKTVGRVSPTDASVLITGESGTGKELIAEAIHRNSLRRNKSFIKVNLGGISASLFESEMFGHKRGAFTDAKADWTGRFELAHKGTIFLDEIGDLDMNSQVKLLRVLQDRTYEVLGDSRSRSVDVRVICATNRDLPAMVAENKFREDLFYRINLITVKLPALRERPGDIPLLASHYVSYLQTVYQRPELSISKKALHWLKGLPFPGNIRELRNLVERTVLVSENRMLEVSDFEQQLLHAPKPVIRTGLPAVGAMTLDEIELAMIKQALELYNHNITKVAKALGLTRGVLYRRLDKFNIPYDPKE